MPNASIMRFRANSWLLNWNCFTLYRVGTWGTILWLFENVILCCDIRTEMVKHKICILTWALNQIGYVNNTGMVNESIWHRSLLIMHSFSVTSIDIAINDISLKTRFFGLHFCRRQYKSICIHFDVIGNNSYRILWNNAK